MNPVLAVDPGTSKCGVAVVGAGVVIDHRVVLLAALAETLSDWLEKHQPRVVLLGDGTAMKRVRTVLETLGAGTRYPLEVVAERHTTERARARYFQDHPPRGWQKLLPLGMRVPPEPYDDYAAVLLAEDFLAAHTIKGQTL